MNDRRVCPEAGDSLVLEDFMNMVLRDQISSAGRSADQILKSDHQNAMFCLDVQDMIQIDLYLFNEIARRVRAWQDENAVADAAAGIEVPVDAHAKEEDEYFALYVSLETNFSKTANLIRVVESTGHVIEGKEQFKKSYRELRGVVGITPAEIRKSLQQVRDKRYRVLER